MITWIVIKVMDSRQPDDPGAVWYGAAFAFLLDVFLLSIAVYVFRSWVGW